MTTEISRKVRRIGRRGAVSAGGLLSALALFFVLFAGPTQAACPATGCDPNDGISPTVQGVSPAENATGVLPGANVTATFSESMDPASISSSTFSLRKEGAADAVPAVVGYDATANAATLTPGAGLAEGATYTATVKGGPDGVKDLVGNTLDADKTWSFKIADVTPPTVTLTSPAEGEKVGPSARATATASDNLGVQRVEFLVDDALRVTDDTAPYEATLDMSTLAHGSSHTISARAVDGDANATTDAKTVTVDRQVALTLGDSPAQNGYTNAAPAPLSFTTDADVAAADKECRVVQGNAVPGAFSTCSSPFSPDLTSDGAYTYEVKVTDDIGNTTSASRSFTLDTTAPTLTVDSGPNNETFGPNTTQTWTFSSGDATSGPPKIECSVVPAGSAASYGPCSGPSSHSVSDKAEGSYTFAGRATDGAGNVRELTRAFTIDATVPTVSLTSPADGSKVGGSMSATATASDNLPGALRVEFLVDGVVRASDNTAPYEVAVGMETFAHGSQHTVAVRAIDGVGNVSVPSSATVTLDRQVSLTLGSTPVHGSSTNAASVPLAFTTDPDVAAAGQMCRVQPNAYAPCSSPFSPDFTTDGTYTYQVKVTDEVGNVASAQRTFTLDRTAPTLTVGGPDNEVFGPNTTQTWNISAADATTGPPVVQCSVEAANAAPSYGRCSGPSSHSVTGKADGSYVLSVRATDGAGNVREVRRTFTIDATPPAVTINSGPANGLRTNQTSFTWGFSAAEPDSTFECRVYESAVTAPAFAPCSGATSHTASGFSSGSYTFQVRGRDALGNRLDGPSASRTFTVDLFRPRIFSVSPGNRTRNVSPGANVAVTFSEAMEAGSIGKTTFKLTRFGTTSPVAATVTYDPNTDRAVLNPTRALQRGVTYRAVVTTGAKDRAGNALALGRAWTFTVRP